LTEVRFHNHHLAYALTWFTLAAFVAAALALVARIDREWWATQA
jgi:surfeit locus 1 family protein